MFQALGKFWSMTLVATLTFFGVVGLPGNEQPAEALRGSMFDPGLIISDSVFYDFGTMTVVEIQRFLDGKVAACRADSSRPGCLKDYRTNTPAVDGSVGRCTALPAKNNVSAAEIIFDVARACGINPRVLLVKLQKEQGLVTSTDPIPRAYEFALGMDCPDTPSGCSAASAGFFWQLYRGAGQLRWYNNPAGSFTWLKPGTVISRPFQANKPSCGSLSFKLENKATAALYYYTPYVPNKAALDNLYGTGDSCSAYGNRNFWRFYHDWFGSPIGGGFLLKAARGATFLIVDEVKYRVPDATLLSSLAPLGPIGTISRDYLDSFTTVGDITPVVRNGGTDRHFFVDNGKRLRFESCEQVASYGLSCDMAVNLTSSQISALELGGDVTNLVVGPSSERFLVEAGVLREILNDASAAEANIALMAPSPIRLAALSYLPVGKPIALQGSFISNRATGQVGIIADESFFPIDAATAQDVNFGIWFQGQGSSLNLDSIKALNQGPTIQSIVADDNGQQYLLASDGKRLIQDSENWIASPPILPASVLTAIPTAAEELIAPAVVRSTTNSSLFLVTGGELRPIQTIDRKAVRASVNNSTIHRISPSAFSQMKKGSQVIPPGALVRQTSNNRLFLVDGLNQLYRIPNVAQASALGLGPARAVTTKALSSYKRSGQLAGVKIICNSTPYVAVAGKFIRVSEETFTHYPTATRTLNGGTCATFKLQSAQGSRFIQTPDKKFFLVENGKKRPLANRAQYVALRGDGPAVISVDNVFASRIPTGSAVKKDAETVTDTVAPAPTQSTTPEQTTSTTSSYTVKSGDTLSGIAARFGTTAKRIRDLNGLSSDLIRIGQVLKLPSASTDSPTPTTTTTKTYTVKSGDTLTGIATRFGTTVKRLRNLNGLTTDLIRIGQVLKLP